MSKKSLGSYVSVKLGKRIKKAVSIKFHDIVQFEKSFLKSHLGEYLGGLRSISPLA